MATPKKNKPVSAQFMTLPKLDNDKKNNTVEEVKNEPKVQEPVNNPEPAVSPQVNVENVPVNYVRSAKKPGPVKYELIPGEKEIRTQIGIPESLNEVIKEEAFRRRITVKQLIGDILMKEFGSKL